MCVHRSSVILPSPPKGESVPFDGTKSGNRFVKGRDRHAWRHEKWKWDRQGERLSSLAARKVEIEPSRGEIGMLDGTKSGNGTVKGRDCHPWRHEKWK